MFTMQSTLLVGQYDWDESRLPKSEFAERISAFWANFPDKNCAGLAVYGDRRNSAELAYFSHLVPKLQDALILLPREGKPRVLVGGGKNAMPTAARQTWVEIEPLGDLAKSLSQWAADLKGKVAFVGDEYLRGPAHKGVAEALDSTELFAQAAATVRRLMQRKRPREIAAVRDAVAALKAVAAALAEAQRGGSGVTDAIVTAEHAAHALGVQEVRTLFSIDGGKTLRPFISPSAEKVAALQAYIAVRHEGYWADGHVALAPSPNAVLAKAREALKALLPMVKPGARCADLARAASEGIRPYQEHPVSAGSAGNGIGLFLDEAPALTARSQAFIEAGCIYSLRVGASDGGIGHGIASAMVLANAGGNEVLWSSI